MKILFQGDSITDCGRNTERGSCQSVGQGYALMVAGELGARYPGKYEFVNRGISGNRIVDVYARIKADGWNLQPDVFSMLIGVNDVWHETLAETPNGVEAERFERVYRMLIQDTLEACPGIRFVLMEPFVLKGPATEPVWEEMSAQVYRRAESVRRLAAEFDMPFVPLQRVFDEALALAPATYWSPDGVHPSPAGHRLMADAWLKVFHESFGA